VLRDVVALQPLERAHRLAQAGGGHAPGADRGADQVDRVVGRRQPLAEQEAIERPEDQALRAAGGGRHHADVARRQALAFDVPARRGPGVDAERAHGQPKASSSAAAPATR